MNAEHAALAKLKLSGTAHRTQDLGQLAELLDDDEQVVTMADAIFRAEGRERRGLAVLTDRRLLCLDKGLRSMEPLAIELAAVTSVEIAASGGSGDAKRGALTIVADEIKTEVARIHPWQRAAEIRIAVIESTARRDVPSLAADVGSVPAGPAPASILRSFGDFESATQAVLNHLQRELGFRHWMVTRTEGEDWIVLQTRKASGAYPIQAGDVRRWSDSLCSRMVRGEGPRMAPRAMDVPAYAAAPMAAELEIGAYVGAPLLNENGTLFGTLCAIDPIPQPAEVVDGQPMVELFARLLSTLLGREQQVAEEVRGRERADQEADKDLLTGLLSRRGWSRILPREEARCKRTGAPACVIVGDLDGLKAANERDGHVAGDELLHYVGRLIAAACRPGDLAARLGGDEFGILAPETPPAAGSALLERLRGVLDAAGVSMSLGLASRSPARGLQAAWESADRAMLGEKAAHRRVPPQP